jgi:PhnB protein
MSIKGGRPDERRVVAHLMVPDGREALNFYHRAFGATVLYTSEIPSGRIVHAHIRIHDSVVMLTEESLQEQGEGSAEERFGVRMASPKSLRGTTVMLEMYVDDVDAAFAQALGAGARVIVEPELMFYGDRYGIVQDIFGHCWAIATVVEQLTPEQVTQRAMERFAPAH